MLIDRIIAILLSILVMIYGTLLLVAQNQEHTVKTYIEEAVDEFVNKACATGTITDTSYLEFVHTLDSTGVSYDIYLIHSRKTLSPTVELEEGENKAQIGNVDYYYLESRNKEILDTLFPDLPVQGIQSYNMQEGDFFRVVIENNSPTIAKRLRQSFSTIKSNTPTIIVVSSGYVGNQPSTT